MNIQYDTKESYKKSCLDCEKEFETDGFKIFNNWISQTRCDECLENFERTQSELSTGIKVDWKAQKWENMSTYALDFNRLPGPAKEAYERITGWQFPKGRGIGLIGPNRIGKSHLIHELARIRFFAGDKVILRTGPRFELLVSDYTSRASEIDDLIEADIVVIDDIDKQTFSQNCQMCLFEVINARQLKQKPLLITSNASGSVMGSEMSERPARAIISRLRECTEFIEISSP